MSSPPEASVRRVRQGPDALAVALQVARRLAARRVPEADVAVAAADSHGLAVRAERHGEDLAILRRQLAPLLAAGKFPQPGRLVAAAADQGLAVRGEGDCGHPTLVPGQYAQLLAGDHVPEADRLIAAGRGELGAVGGKRHRPDLVVVAGQDAPVAAPGDAAEPEPAVGAGQGHGLTVGGHGQAEDRGGEFARLAQRGGLVRRPGADDAARVAGQQFLAVGREGEARDAAAQLDVGSGADVRDLELRGQGIKLGFGASEHGPGDERPQDEQQEQTRNTGQHDGPPGVVARFHDGPPAGYPGERNPSREDARPRPWRGGTMALSPGTRRPL